MDTLEGRLRPLGTKRVYHKGELLFSALDEATGFYLVLDGEIRVFKMDEAGREVEVARLRPGDFLGEAVIFAAPAYPAFAQAVRDSEVLFFEKRAVIQKAEKDPATAKLFLTLLAQKCLTLSERIEVLSLKTVRQRLVQYLLSQCPRDGTCLVELKVKKGELAKLLGTISETLSRNLREMEKDGLIEVGARTIRVKDCARLQSSHPF